MSLIPHSKQRSGQVPFKEALVESVLRYVQVFEMFYDFLVDNEAQQGASLKTLNGLLGSAENATLFLLNGDVSYARSALLTQSGKHNLPPRACLHRCPSLLAHFCSISHGELCQVILVQQGSFTSCPDDRCLNRNCLWKAHVYD